AQLDRLRRRARAPADRSRPTSASSYGYGVARLELLYLHAGSELTELCRSADQRRERSVVAGNAALGAEQLERKSRPFGAQGVVIADREHCEIGRVEPADELHIAEDARVAGEVDALALG